MKKELLLIVVLGICTSTFAQERELIIEKNGFKWYKLTHHDKVGAEDINNNIIIPISRGYNFIVFHSRDGHIGFFGTDIKGKEGVCDLFGKEIIPPKHMIATYDKYEGFGYSDSPGQYTYTGWYLDSEGKATRVAPKSSASLSTITSSSSSSSSSTSSSSSNSNKQKSVEPGLKYSGTYTESPQGYHEQAGRYTEGIGPGFVVSVKIFDDKVIVLGTEYYFKSKSGKWRVYTNPNSFMGTTTSYYVDDNFNMKKVQNTPNPFNGSTDTFTYQMEKGSVTFSIIPSQNPGGGSTGGGSVGGRSSGSGHRCNLCNGTGRKVRESWSGDKTSTKWCNECNKRVGMGHSHTKCDLCGGDGWCD